VALTATVAGTGASLTGSVTSKDGAIVLGLGAAGDSEAALAVKFSTTGNHRLTVVYV
jgi:hypothetical protein